jgi:predicted RNase H-like nuclease
VPFPDERVAAPTSYDGPPVLGVDGCRAGWVGALLIGRTVEVLVASDIESLIAAAVASAPTLQAVAVDMPIGLPDHGRRRADVEARTRLPVGRKSSVFPTPTRAAAAEPTFVEAGTTSRATTDGRGISQQTFRLLPKILQVDRYVRSGPAVAVIEAHPEVSLAEIDPLCVVPRKNTPAGAGARREALLSVGIEVPSYVRGQGYAFDDLVDACAVARTAGRYAAGTAHSMPDPPEVFSDGIAAAIWV